MRNALLLRGWTQGELADKIHCSRQTIYKLLIPAPVSKETFRSVAEQLNLEWEAIADMETLMSNDWSGDNDTNEKRFTVSTTFVVDENDWEEIDTLLTRLRQKAKSFSIKISR